MRVQAAATDHIPARRRKVEVSGAGQHGAGQQDGSPDAPAQVRVQVGRPHFACRNPPGTTAQVFELHTQAGNQLAHIVHVTDIGNVVQDDRFIRHERGRQDG